MDNKKALRMAVTLAIINMPLLAQAADVSPVRITDGSTYTMTADSVINTGSNTTGILSGIKMAVRLLAIMSPLPATAMVSKSRLMLQGALQAAAIVVLSLVKRSLRLNLLRYV